MANIIAVIWDFDKTLVDGYMQDPIFKEYNVEAKEFWQEVNALPEKYLREQGVKVNPETIYLNHFISKTKDGTFKGLNNEALKKFGAELKFFAGIPTIFAETKKLIETEARFREYDIRVEHYIVSTGFAQVIKGSAVMDYVECVWGCELIDGPGENGEKIISEIGYTIDNTTKTRAIFEINKGVHVHTEIDVNTKMEEEKRRVPFENMIYIADGPSDVPAFSLIKGKGGETFAIYPKGQADAFKQAEQLRKDGRVSMYAEADYSEGTTAHMWIVGKIKEFAERIFVLEKAKITQSISGPLKHLNS